TRRWRSRLAGGSSRSTWARPRRCCSSRRAGSGAVADDLFILDGDNVAHVRGAGPDYVRAREQLVGDVAGFASEAGIDIVLVFAGEGGGRRIGRVQVVHSGRETADTVIERLAHRRAGD